MRSDYISLATIKRQAGIASSKTDWDTLIAETLIPGVSRQVDDWCHRHFYPLVATYKWDFQDSNRLRLKGQELLEVTTMLNGDDSTMVEGTDFILYPLVGPPYRYIDIKIDTGTAFLISGTPQQALSIAGVWGYHQDYSNAWRDTGDTVQDAAGLSATVASVTVTDASDFSPRETIKIGTEHMMVTATNETTEVLTVVRGINGSTAAIHANGDAITRWYTHAAIVRATQEWIVFIMNTVEEGGISRQRMGDYEQAISFFLLDQTAKGPPGGVRPVLSALRFVDIWWNY